MEDYGRTMCQKDAKWEGLDWPMLVLKVEEREPRIRGKRPDSGPGAQKMQGKYEKKIFCMPKNKKILKEWWINVKRT